jgi:hypothetical protein
VSSDRKDFARGSPESPPPYSGDTQLWAEDMDNYLRRRMQKLEERIQALEADAGIARSLNDAARRTTQGSTEG